MNKRFNLLACPICKQKLLQKKLELRCSSCRISYPIEHNIPVLIDRSKLPKHLEGQIRYFASEAKDYSQSFTLDAWQKKYVERLLLHIPTCIGKVVVDDGCGSGYISIELAKRGAIVIACDLNMSALVRLGRAAQKLGLKNRILPVCCTSEYLPVKSRCADVIAANAILEHLPRERLAIRDIKRIAKAGAVTMITVPIAYHLLNPLFIPLNVIHDRRIGHLRRYTKEMLESRFPKWHTVRVFYTGHTVKIVKTILNMFLHIYDAEEIENQDELLIDKKIFASNVGVILQK